MGRILTIFIGFVFLLSQSVYGQEPAYKNYTDVEGLASTNVYNAMQDHKGFIWFATDNGVSRFDGTHFRNYSIADGLMDNDILKIVEDSKGRLWFLTFNGNLCFYLNNKIYNRTNCPFLSKINNKAYITAFLEDSKKNIWIAFGNFILVKITPASEVTSINLHFKSNYLWEKNDGTICGTGTGRRFVLRNNKCILIPPPINIQGGVLLGDDSLLVINGDNRLATIGKQGKITIIKNTLEFKADNITNVAFDSKKNLWIYSINGAMEIEDGSFTTDHEREFLKDYSITSVLRDKDDNLWFTSIGNGVFMIPSSNIQLFNEKGGLIKNNVSAFAVIDERQLLLGAPDGSVQLIDNGKIKAHWQSAETSLNKIIKMEMGKDGSVWIVSEGSIFKYRNGHFKEVKDTAGWNKSLYIANDGVPYIGSGYGLKKIINGSVVHIVRNDIVNRIYAIEQKGDDGLLLGTDYGLYHLENNKMIPDTNAKPLLSHAIRAFAYTSDSALWIGTNDNGLLRVYNGSIKQFTLNEHLLSNHCNSLFADSNKIYVATNNGLNIVYEENNTYRIVSYSVANGLVSNHINQVGKMGKHTIVLATDHGLVIFDDRKLLPAPPSIPYLNTVTVNDSLKPLSDKYNFKHNENNIRIDFGAINFNSANNTNYRYKLVGADANWNYTTYTSVKYSYLHPGNYKFSVATKNTDGTWNPQTASFSFYIETPWWQTWWFRTAIGLCLIGIIYIIIRWRFNAYKEKVNRERALAESELKALRSQINPHFIYNSLNAIQDFILHNQKEDAHLYLTKFATLMRSILAHSRTSTVALEDEIASLQLYLELEALRFNNKFTFEFNVDEKIDTEYVQIPSMILQPYIENAILHGLATVTEGGKISIGFCLKDNFLKSTIEDNGVGRKRSAEARKQRVWKGHKSLGMTVTQERIDLISSHQKQKTSIEINDLLDEDDKARGTRVTIYFPLSG